MASNMATKIRNPTAIHATTTPLLSDVFDKPFKLHLQSVWVYNSHKQVLSRLYIQYVWSTSSKDAYCLFLFQAILKTETIMFLELNSN